MAGEWNGLSNEILRAKPSGALKKLLRFIDAFEKEKYVDIFHVGTSTSKSKSFLISFLFSML